jgi:hypothetical protein
MKILRRHRTWLHTHFVTDRIRLPTHRMDEIQRQMGPVLRKMGIVFGGEVGVTIVLECKPLPDVLEFLHLELQRIVGPIPARPRTVALLEPREAVESGRKPGLVEGQA